MAAMEELILLMRQQGRTGEQGGIQLAEMTGPRSAKIGDFELMEEDLYIADTLLETYRGEEGEIYYTALKAGDVVAISQITEDKYVILARVVGK